MWHAVVRVGVLLSVKGVREIGLGVIMARYGLDCGFVYQWVDV